MTRLATSLAWVTVVSMTAAAQTPADTGALGLPVVEVPAQGTGHTLVVFLSGDGGWASIDKQISNQLAERGLPVVGLNLRDYLKTKRTPDELSRDVARLARAYEAKWHRDSLIVVGFSRGAGLAPFAISRFPEEIQKTLSMVALIGLNRAANFKWHLQDVLRDVRRDDDVPTLPEVEKLRGMKLLCFYGADEKESGCRDTTISVERVERPGGHHFDGDYKRIADIIVNAIS